MPRLRAAYEEVGAPRTTVTRAVLGREAGDRILPRSIVRNDDLEVATVHRLGGQAAKHLTDAVGVVAHRYDHRRERGLVADAAGS